MTQPPRRSETDERTLRRREERLAETARKSRVPRSQAELDRLHEDDWDLPDDRLPFDEGELL